MKRLTALLITGILLGVLPVSSPAQESDSLVIALIQKMSVLQIDSTLGNEPFIDWLKKLAGEKTTLTWEIDDCGEQTGVPAIDKERDIPTCVAVYGILPDGRKFGIAIITGTVQKGPLETPALYDAYIQDHGSIRNARVLRDLPPLFRPSPAR